MKLLDKISRWALPALVVLLMLPASQPAQARTYTSETLHYQVVFHWGVIWKHAANATLTINRRGAGYHAELSGRTVSWANTFYPVRDTLRVNMRSNFTPTRYEKCTHEKDYYARDVVNFATSGGITRANCHRYRPDKPTAHVNLATSGQAYDMLSVFYMLRNLDFKAMPKGKRYTTCIFSGKRKETLTIRYVGTSQVTLRNGTKRQGYHVRFSFTQDGRKKSSNDMDCWVSTDASRVPLMLSGKLHFGEIKAYLAN